MELFGNFSNNKGTVANKQAVWIPTRKEHHGRSSPNPRRPQLRQRPEKVNAHPLLRFLKSIRPSGPTTTTNQAQQDAACLVHLMVSRISVEPKSTSCLQQENDKNA